MDNMRRMLVEAGAVLEGEFFFALKKQGNVSCKYINMDSVFTDPDLVSVIGARLAKPWTETVKTFAAPAVGGIPLLYAAAEFVGGSPRVAWADKQKDGTFAFERMGFTKAIKDRKVVLLEDIVQPAARHTQSLSWYAKPEARLSAPRSSGTAAT